MDARIPHPAPRPRPAYAYQATVDPQAQAAADRMEAQGGSPKIQLVAAKLSSGQRNLTYKPHQGAREKARRLRQQTRA